MTDTTADTITDSYEGPVRVYLPDGAILTTGLIGGLLAWFRMRWASLLPAVLTHNGINSAAVLAAYLT